MMVRKRYFQFGRGVDKTTKDARDFDASIRAAEELIVVMSQVDALRRRQGVDGEHAQ
jgi:hypothetical protein